MIILKRFLLFALCFLLLAQGINIVRAESGDSDLFFAAQKRGSRKMPTDRSVTRSRAIEINWKLLDKLSVGAERFVRLKLFDGLEFDATVREVGRRAVDCYSIFASLNGKPESLLILTREKDALAVSLRIAGELNVTLKNAGNGVFLISELDNSKFPPCGGGLPCEGGVPPVPRGGGIHIQATTQFTVLMLYTQAVASAAGGTDQIRAISQQAIDVSNVAYTNSGLDIRAVLVERLAVTYDESSGYSSALNALTNTSDGIMDVVHTWREQYQADLVSLLIDNGEFCGMAWLAPGNQAYGFSVCNWSCAVSNLTQPHELGHNMGCGHDVGNGDGVFTYSHGWRFTVGNTQYRTVMAYAPGTRVAVFSSPDVMYGGGTTGNAAAADNVRTIQETIQGIALFRDGYFVDGVNGLDANPGTRVLPFKTVTKALSVVSSGGRLYIKAGNYNQLPRIAMRVSLHNWDDIGAVRIGTP